MKDWFQGLAPREQMLVALAGVLTVVVVIYLGVWLPLDRANSRLENQVESQRELVTDLRQLRGRLPSPSAGGTASAPGGQSLVVVVDSTVRQRGLGTALKRSRPLDGDSIQVSFENVAFDALVEWLGQLGSQHGIDIGAASFSNRAEPGRVDATLTLERAL
ncbi:type II secretion system protein GspM [Lentisalinibacter orientalis]|jgi:general secretion pathway protein M|uniref:type II secretion system protein GspM n=1 Tax=Lentisalinibacter orientalis TaxID=2992241 RepID=UPI00386D49B5